MSGNDRDKPFMPELAKRFVELGFSIVATHGTARVLEEAGLRVERVYKVKEGRPNVVDLIKGERIQLIINTPHGSSPGSTRRRSAAPPSPRAFRRSPRCRRRRPHATASRRCNAARRRSTRCSNCMRSGSSS